MRTFLTRQLPHTVPSLHGHQVLQKTTMPLETLDLSKTCMTSAGATTVAALLVANSDAETLPLRRHALATLV